MRRKYPLSRLIVLLLILGACAGRDTNPPLSNTPEPPKVIHHTLPNTRVDTAAIEAAGCTLRPFGASSEEQEGTCTSESPYTALGCYRIYVEHRLGGLTPAYPIVLCAFDDPAMSAGWPPVTPTVDQIYRENWLEMDVVTYSRYVVKVGDKYEMLLSKERVKVLYAPITSAEEAFSYTELMSDRFSLNDFPDDLTQDYDDFYSDVIEETHITEVENGYRVFLFEEVGECDGKRFLYRAPVDVQEDGTIIELPRDPIFGYTRACEVM